MIEEKRQIRKLTWEERWGVDPERVGENLEKLRKKKNLTQSDLQNLLGFHFRTTISNWERGMCLPTIENFVKLSLIYGVSLHDLILGYASDSGVPEDFSFCPGTCPGTIDLEAIQVIDRIQTGKILRRYRNIHYVVEASKIRSLSLDRLQGIFDDTKHTWCVEAIHKCEQGISLPSSQHIYTLSRLYGVKIDDLVCQQSIQIRFQRDDTRAQNEIAATAGVTC